MKYHHYHGLPCLAMILLTLLAGCGGGGEATNETDQQGAAPTSPQSDDGMPQPGRPPLETEMEINPRVEIKTSAGTFTVTLRRDLVPRTVDNFLSYVDRQFYDGTIIHQVIRDYAILGGNYTMENGRIMEKPGGLGINNEAAQGLSNKRQTIAMARKEEDADSARCQFFINLDDNTSLDYEPPKDEVPLWQTAGYCAFGTVDPEGMAVVDRIAESDVTSVNEMDRVPVETITIESIRRL